MLEKLRPLNYASWTHNIHIID